MISVLVLPEKMACMFVYSAHSFVQNDLNFVPLKAWWAKYWQIFYDSMTHWYCEDRKYINNVETERHGFNQEELQISHANKQGDNGRAELCKLNGGQSKLQQVQPCTTSPSVPIKAPARHHRPSSIILRPQRWALRAEKGKVCGLSASRAWE